MTFFTGNTMRFCPYVKITIKNQTANIGQNKTYKKDVDFKNPIWMELFEFQLQDLKTK